jgi:hypothetical protein
VNKYRVLRWTAIGWLVLLGITGAFLLVGWMVLPTGEPFWQLAKALTTEVALAAPAVRYLRRTPADRKAIKNLKEMDRFLDEYERNHHV